VRDLGSARSASAHGAGEGARTGDLMSSTVASDLERTGVSIDAHERAGGRHALELRVRRLRRAGADWRARQRAWREGKGGRHALSMTCCSGLPIFSAICVYDRPACARERRVGTEREGNGPFLSLAAASAEQRGSGAMMRIVVW
jgi:hypothetical protein